MRAAEQSLPDMVALHMVALRMALRAAHKTLLVGRTTCTVCARLAWRVALSLVSDSHRVPALGLSRSNCRSSIWGSVARLTHGFHFATTQNRQTAEHGLLLSLNSVARISLALLCDMVNAK
jgi:hypothetical protein